MARSTLADANDAHDWRIYADFAQVLIGIARPLYASDPIGVDLDQSLYALDSTTIDLCLSLFPWAKFRKYKAAVKMHTLLDLRGNIPTFIRITDGKVHDVNILDEILPEAGAFYVMDRGYVDFERLYIFTLSAHSDDVDQSFRSHADQIGAKRRRAFLREIVIGIRQALLFFSLWWCIGDCSPAGLLRFRALTEGA